MNINLLISISEVNPSENLTSLADKLSYGGTMVLIGMLTVFAVLVIIMLSLMLFKFFFHDLPQKKKSAIPAPKAQVVSEPVTPVLSNDEEIVAAIAAAIAMAESESDGIKFRVVSFKRR